METEKKERDQLVEEYRVVRSRFLPFPVDELCRILMFWFGRLGADQVTFTPERKRAQLYEALKIIVDLIPAKLPAAETRLFELTNSFSADERVDFYMLLCSLGYHIEQTRMEIPSDRDRQYLSGCIAYHARLQDQRMLPATQAAVEHAILLNILHNARTGFPRYMWKSFESTALRLIGVKKSLSDVLESPIKLLDDYLKESCSKMAVEIVKKEIEPEKLDVEPEEEEGAPPAPPAPPPVEPKRPPAEAPRGSLTSEELEQQRKVLKSGPAAKPGEPSKKSTMGELLEGLKKRRGAIEPTEEEDSSSPWNASANSTFFASRSSSTVYCSTCFSHTQFRCPVCLCRGQCAQCQNSTLHIHLPL